MKKKHNEGFSLVEVLVAIVILGIFVVPTCSSLILSFQMNQKTAQMLKAQQAVSSAVEELKAKGISGTDLSTDDLSVVCQYEDELYYNVTITSKKVPSVKVTTIIRNTTNIAKLNNNSESSGVEPTPSESTTDESTDGSNLGGDSQ